MNFRLVRVFTLGITMTCAVPAFATTECERAAESALILVKNAVQLKALSPLDIQFMISEPDRIQNPFIAKEKNPYNLALRQRLARALSQIKGDTLAALRTQLQALLESSEQTAARVEEAILDMAPVLAPREVKIEIPPGFGQRHIHSIWHTDKNGELQRAIYNHQQHELIVTNRKLVFQRNFKALTGGDADAFTAGKVAMLSLPKDRLVLAHMQWDGESLLVFDKERNKEFVAKVDFTPTSIRLIRGQNAKVFVLAQGKKNLTIYEIGDGTLIPYLTFETENQISELVVLNSEEGKGFIAAQDSMSRVQILDLQNKSTRVHKSNELIEGIKGALLPNGEYVFVISVIHSGNNNKHFEIIRGSTVDVFTSAQFPQSTSRGSLLFTPQGKLYYPVVTNKSLPGTKPARFRVQIDLFDVLQPPVPPTFLDRLLRKTPRLTPQLRLETNVNGISQQSPVWLSPANQRVILAVPTFDGDSRTVSIFEPDRQTSPIGVVDYGQFAAKSNFELVEVPRLQQVLLRISDGVNGHTDVYDVEPGTTRIDRLNIEPISGMIADQHGDIYVAGESYSGPPSSRAHRFRIFRLTIGGREASER